MRHFSFRPALTLKGRQFRGIRGWAGKPAHPPLTDVPAAAYLIAGAFDLISFIGTRTAWSREFYQAATLVLIAGALVSLGTVSTGFFDWWRSSEPGTQARRTINAHAVIMICDTVVVFADLGLRWLRYHPALQPPSAVLGLSLAAALLVVLGSTYGGTLVFGYGFNVETAGDHPVWHRSEADVFPGPHSPATPPAAPPTAHAGDGPSDEPQKHAGQAQRS